MRWSRSRAIALNVTFPAEAWARAWHAWSLNRAIALFHGWRGERADASRVLRDGLELQRRAPVPLADADYLASFAALAQFAGEDERAAVLAGAARRSMGRYRSWRGHDAGAIYVLVRQRCEESLGPEAAARAIEGEEFGGPVPGVFLRGLVRKWLVRNRHHSCIPRAPCCMTCTHDCSVNARANRRVRSLA